MIILSLPLEEKCPDNWQAFNLALASIGLSLVEISSKDDNCIKAKINAESEEQQQAVIDLVQLCFSKCYSV